MNNCEIHECCCKCTFYTSLNKHPWNTGKFNGSVSEQTELYACTAEQQTGNKRRSVISQSRHSIGCEMFTKDDRELI